MGRTTERRCAIKKKSAKLLRAAKMPSVSNQKSWEFFRDPDTRGSTPRSSFHECSGKTGRMKETWERPVCCNKQQNSTYFPGLPLTWEETLKSLEKRQENLLPRIPGNGNLHWERGRSKTKKVQFFQRQTDTHRIHMDQKEFKRHQLNAICETCLDSIWITLL